MNLALRSSDPPNQPKFFPRFQYHPTSDVHHTRHPDSSARKPTGNSSLSKDHSPFDHRRQPLLPRPRASCCRVDAHARAGPSGPTPTHSSGTASLISLCKPQDHGAHWPEIITSSTEGHSSAHRQRVQGAESWQHCPLESIPIRAEHTPPTEGIRLRSSQRRLLQDTRCSVDRLGPPGSASVRSVPLPWLANLDI